MKWGPKVVVLDIDICPVLQQELQHGHIIIEGTLNKRMEGVGLGENMDY